MLRDITETRRLTEQLSYQATHDALTQLLNRPELERRLERVLDSVGLEQSKHALCFMDLDQYKVVNDTCGHVAGDDLLRQISAVFHQEVRKRDTVARLGGDEFGVLMEHCSLVNNACQAMGDNGQCTEDNRLLIRTVEKNARIEIQIIDTGPGIDDADFHIIFEPLYRSKTY